MYTLPRKSHYRAVGRAIDSSIDKKLSVPPRSMEPKFKEEGIEFLDASEVPSLAAPASLSIEIASWISLRTSEIDGLMNPCA